MNIKNIFKFTLTKAYITALSLVACMSILTFILMTIIIDKNSFSGTIINISGKQRMLSQRTALFANELIILPDNEKPGIRRELIKITNAFEKTHIDLINGNPERGLPPIRSEEIKNIYFGSEDSLDQKIKIYIKHLRELINAPPEELTADNPALYAIDHVDAIELLPLLDKVVAQHETESHESLKFLHNVEKGVLTSVLIILLLEALFLFRPLIRRTEEKTAELERQTLELAAAREDSDAARKLSEDATKLKSEFLANMSHEIRTPINGVIGMTNILLTTKLTNTQRNYTETVMSSAESLLQIVNDILDFSKIEAGKLKFEQIPFDLQTIIEETADIITIKAQEKNLEVLIRIAPAMPRYMIGDPSRIKQIFLNLATNAVKFTQDGHILFNIDVNQEYDGKIEFHASVEDTGIGIPEDKQDYIFQKFNQADETTTRKFGGTGLGLAICQELTKCMDGEIGVESIVGSGSKFWFTFSIEKDETKKQQDITDLSANLSNLNILIFDENQTARNIAEETISIYDMNVLTTTSLDQALDELQTKHKNNAPYDICILTAKNTDKIYIELIKTLNQDGILKKTSIIFISPTHDIDDITKIEHSGCAAHLTSPVSNDDLIKTISQIKSAQNDGTKNTLITRDKIRGYKNKTEEIQQETLNFQNKTALLVEDNTTNLEVATIMLEQIGLKVTPAINGVEAVKAFKQTQFDLIFMDCNMPEMDGFEATKTIRNIEEQEKLKRTPIVAFTAHAMKGDDQKCFESGMDDYLAKPIKTTDLINILEKWLRNKPARVSKTTKKLQNDTDQNEIIDAQTLSDIQDLMGEKFSVMLNQYLENGKKYIAQAETAIANDDAKTLADNVHPLKSSSASLGAMRVSNLATEIEKCADENNLKNITTLFTELKTAFEETEIKFLAKES